MIDLKDFLRKQNRFVDLEQEDGLEDKIRPRRSKLVANAQGSIREHLRLQLHDALERFVNENPPEDEKKIF